MSLTAANCCLYAHAGATLLRCKAFSQEVYGLGFCPHSPGYLVCCGTGHIRFWKMALTFTGLKLQVRGMQPKHTAAEAADIQGQTGSSTG